MPGVLALQVIVLLVAGAAGRGVDAVVMFMLVM